MFKERYKKLKKNLNRGRFMNKGDLVNFVKEKTGFGKAECEKVVNAFFEAVTDALRKKEEVSFIGFGSFSVAKREAREGRNPRTGEKLTIAASHQVRFKPGKTLKDVCQ
ncbi:MAG: HU family DNA-binding protein [Holosporales bacterium]